MLLPAILCSEQVWLACAMQLAEVRDVHLVGRLDQLVRGDRPTLDSLAEAVTEQFAALGSYVLGGLSLGGLIAARIAERGDARLEALVLASVRAQAPSLDERRRQQRILEMAARIGREPLLEGLAAQMFGPRHRAERPEDLAAWIAEADSWRASLLAGLAEAVQEFAVVDALARSRVPTLVLRGEQDPLVPPADLEQLAMQTSVHTRTLADAGHLVPREQPHAVASAVEGWLASARESTRAF
ncbi:MAG TPA: alpha/beta hydrolase [Enhygromyxa sp.]|nr:alpha/beta hydrolase [Enhygromyxa sp.]